MKTHEMFDKVNDPGPGKLTQNKSQLAKLMATENITIRHRHIKTAKFDMKDRVLHCPIWKDMNGDIYDLLMGHEISHALNTPLDGWHDTIVNDKIRPKIKNFLNVCEDIRIEKLIKRKYPGIRKPFSQAYKDLFEREFFGKHDVLLAKLNTLGLIDRMNLRFKVGAHLNVEFDKEEQKFIDRAENLETFEDVVKLARDVYDYQKFKEPEKQQKKKDGAGKDDKKDKKKSDKKKDKSESKDKKDGDQDDANGEEQEDNSGDTDDSESEDESDDDGEEDGEGGDDGEPTDDSDEGEGDGDGEIDEDNSSDKSSKTAGRDPEEPSSSTDEAFRKEEQKLVDKFGPGQIYMNMPEVDLKKVIIPHKVVLAKYEDGIKYAMTSSGDMQRKLISMDYGVIASCLNKSFQNRNRGFISMLVKEFEMRKNANQYARQLISKSGELDDKRLARYKLTNDIFRKVTTITKGKSHGMIMFLDFSGSMNSTIRDILEQVLVLVTFCKRVGIPFDVYGFGDAHNYNWSHHDSFKVVNDSYTFGASKFCLRHLISSNLKGNAYKRAFTMLNVVAQITNNVGRLSDIKAIFNKPDYKIELNSLGFGLGGTPFLETLTASMSVIRKFKEDHHNDIVNVIYLSDGDGVDELVGSREFQQMDYNERRNTTIGFQDYRTKIKVLSDDKMGVPYQTALTKLIATVTGCRHIGYFFGSENEIQSKIRYNKDLQNGMTEHLKFLTNNGFVAVPNIGYDNYYYVNKDQMGYSGELKFYPGTSMDMIGEKFTEHQKKKMNSKLIIKQFAQDVAE